MRFVVFCILIYIFIPFTCFAQESKAQTPESYYLIGWLNNWDQQNKDYPFVLQDDGVTWKITVSCNTDEGWFKIVPSSVFGRSDFWKNLLCAPYDGCQELSGEMVVDGGAWYLARTSGTYTIEIVPSEFRYHITLNESIAQSFSGTLPVLYINTENPVDSKDNYVHGSCFLNVPNGSAYSPLGSEEAPLSLWIKGRGNYTWSAFEKKPYRLKFEEKVTPMGLTQSRHFVLMANADDDYATLRNTVGFELSRLMGLDYTPSQRPVELVLNGDYKGLYMLTEKIRVAHDRVNIVEQDNRETDPYNITGGWLIEIDNYDDDQQIRFKESNGEMLRFTYHSPDTLSEEQYDYLSDCLKATDAAIYQTDKSSTEWEEKIDMDVLARYYIVQEIMDDCESFHGSCFISKDRGFDSKLKFGPVWDFGNAFRRDHLRFIYDKPSFSQSWIGEIARYPRFQERVKQLWWHFLSVNYSQVDTYIDEFINQIAEASQCDGIRWPQYNQDNINGRKDSFKWNLSRKVQFLTEQWGAYDTGIKQSTDNHAQEEWFTLDGRQLGERPVKSGIYLYKGRKVVVK